MSLTITLITPPDIFENDSIGIFLINLTETEQDEATKWLADSTLDLDVNIYFSQNEPYPVWFLHAMASSKHKYINLDNTNGMVELLSSYVLSKPSTYYSLSDKNKQAVLEHINVNRVGSVKDFLERVLSDSQQKQ